MGPPRPPGALPPQGVLLLAALVLVWGAFWPLLKLAVAEVPIFSYRAASALLGAAGLFTLARLGGHSLALPREDRWPILLAGLLNIAGWFYFSALGVSLMPSSRATIIAYTMPLWAFLLGIPVLKERPTRRHWVGLALGLAAVLLLVTEDLETLRRAPLGVLAMLAAAMSVGCGAVVVKRFQWRMPLLTLTAWQLAVGAVPLTFAALVVDRGWSGPISAQAALAIAYTIGLGTIFGMSVWFRLIRLVPVSVAALPTVLIPIVGVLSSAAILGEVIGWREVAALALVVFAVSRVISLPPLRPLARRLRERLFRRR